MGGGHGPFERRCAYVIARGDAQRGHDRQPIASCPIFSWVAVMAPLSVAARNDVSAATLEGAMTATHSLMPDFQLGARDQEDLVRAPN